MFSLACIYLAIGLTWGAVTLMTATLWRYQLWSAYVKMMQGEQRLPSRRLPNFERTLWLTLVLVWPVDVGQQFLHMVVLGYRYKLARLPGDSEPAMDNRPWHADNPLYMPDVKP